MRSLPVIAVILTAGAACGGPSEKGTIEIELQLAEDAWFDTPTPTVAGGNLTAPGLLLPLNADDSDGDSTTDNTNDRVDGAADAKQLTILRVKQLTDKKRTGDKIVLKKEGGGGNVRVFRKEATPSASKEILDTSAGVNTETNAADSVDINDDAMGADVELWVEGVSPGPVKLCAKRKGGANAKDCAELIVIPALQPIVNGDTDRNGTADGGDLAGHRAWTTAAGAIVFVNSDRDCPTGPMRPDNYDVPVVIRCALDEADIGRLRIDLREVDLTGAPGWKIELRYDVTTGKNPLRFFNGTTAGTAAITEAVSGSGTTERRTIDVSAISPGGAELVFGVEGRQYDKQVVVELCVVASSTAATCDKTVLRTNPVTFQSNLEPVARVHVALDPDNQLLRDALTTALSPPGVAVDPVTAGNPFIQDQIEVGGVHAPRGTGQCVVHLPRDQGSIPYGNAQLAAGVGHESFQDMLGSGGYTQTMGDFGGSLEVLPSAGTTLGKLIVGNNMTTDLKSRLAALSPSQATPPVEIDTKWLAVGHVDEVAGVFPVAGGFRIAVGDADLASDLIEGLVPGINKPPDHFALAWRCSGPDKLRSPSCIAKGTVTSASAKAGATAARLSASGVTFNPSWKWLRIYKNGPGSSARGQVARISSVVSSTTVEVDQVWNLPQAEHARCAGIAAVPGVGVTCTLPALPLATDTWFVLPKAGDEFVVVQETVDGAAKGAVATLVPSLYTVGELRDTTLNAEFYAVQGEVQKRLNNTVATFNAAAPSVTIIRLPVFYVAKTVPAPNKIALGESYLPNAANFQVVALTPTSSVIFAVRQYGPKFSSAADPFETLVTSRLGGSVVFLEDWDTYHRNFGEVHCGTNLFKSGATQWWP